MSEKVPLIKDTVNMIRKEPTKVWYPIERLEVIHTLAIHQRTILDLLKPSDDLKMQQVRLALIAIETLSGLNTETCELNRELFRSLCIGERLDERSLEAETDD